MNKIMNEILQYLKTHGEGADADIAVATGISLADVRIYLSELAAQREVMACHSIRFEGGEKVEEIVCRLTGYLRPAIHAGKPKAPVKRS